MNTYIRFSKIMLSFLALVSRRLPDDVMSRLMEMRLVEDSSLQQEIYDAYFENFRLAENLGRPCCQDTGILHFYIRAGATFPFLGNLQSWLGKCVKEATRSIPLRPNTVDFFIEKNTENGLGERIPWTNWEIVPDWDGVEITVYFAGGGCCLPGQAKVFTPSQGYEAVAELVFDVVLGLGINACPPVIIGVGLGENIENASVLSKKAYLRSLGTHHPHEKGAAFEKLLLDGINGLGIGAQGLRGKAYAMAVHVESSGRHTATIAAAVNLSCYAHRRGMIRFDRSLNYELVHYKGVQL